MNRLRICGLFIGLIFFFLFFIYSFLVIEFVINWLPDEVNLRRIGWESMRVLLDFNFDFVVYFRRFPLQFRLFFFSSFTVSNLKY
uniref:Uncharacterized protein n=1 Tax=Oryza glaberrima TaxID=4538 RepID=I1PJM7_ORYGL